ncbi:hypothetical protein EOM89_12520, partial [Candidatus Falkowbacteria bacterium]|nr:hypothetical protein [Candidatus Falkowbacteria bacterium]
MRYVERSLVPAPDALTAAPVLALRRDYLRYLALMDFGHVLFVFSGFTVALSAHMGCSSKESFQSLVRNPIPWAMIAGATLAILG